MARRTSTNRELRHILRSPSLFRQLLDPLQASVRAAISAEKESRWFPSFPVLVHLLAGVYFQVAQMRSLRELISVLGINQPRLALQGPSPKRSTFSDANNSPRRLRVIRQVFALLVVSTQRSSRTWKGLRRLAALDATLLHCVASAGWADFRKEVNACKAHILFDLARSVPRKLVLTTGRVHDRRPVSSFLESGWTYIVDRAYNDYSLFAAMETLGAFFVTRAKVGSVYTQVRKHHVSRAQKKAGVRDDRTIILGAGITRMQTATRLVRYQAQDGRVYEFLTNRFDLPALTIAELYHARWGIEIFFKWLKRTLRMDRPLGRSAIAYEIHVLMALITDILLKLLCNLPAGSRHIAVATLRNVREHLFVLPTPQLLRDITQCVRQ
jgi:putative transposase